MSIKAFVGHSFSKEDEKAVNAILQYLDDLRLLLPQFIWSHAKSAEPRLVDEKVRDLFKDKNVFIGICTKKEKVIANASLRAFEPPFFGKKLFAPATAYEWKTSDWIIQEIGLAIGLGLKVILLVENGLRLPGELQGNLEYINFNPEAPEGCFSSLTQMLGSLVPKTEFVEKAEQLPATAPEIKDPVRPQFAEWARPRVDWSRDEFAQGYMYSILVENWQNAEDVNRVFFEARSLPMPIEEWTALKEYARLFFDKGGDFSILEKQLEKKPDNAKIKFYLAKIYQKYGEQKKAGDFFKQSAESETDLTNRVDLLCDAAIAKQKADASKEARELLDRARVERPATVEAEAIFLKAEQEIARLQKEDEFEIACMARLLDIDPFDNHLRFSLAFKCSKSNLSNLSLYHYSRISPDKRSALAWNNLGVALDEAGLPAKSVAAYEEARLKGETLAMSNIANKLVEAGFLDDAKKICDEAIKIENYHENINHSLISLRGVYESEEEKEKKLSKMFDQ